MSQYDQYPIDYTGFGPAGGGNAPTIAEQQAALRNRHFTQRAMQVAQNLDPTALAMRQKIIRSGLPDASPDALRRAMFSSQAGQLAADTAAMMRSNGLLGSGDPIGAAMNISQGVAGGGFRASMGGANSYGNGPVNGNGIVSEYVSNAFQKKIMSDMYGGVGDTGRMHGFSIEDSSKIFQRLAGRGAIGKVAHVQRNASLDTRMAAAVEGARNTGDLDLYASLKQAGENMGGGSDADKLAKLKKIAEGSDNKKMIAEVESLGRTDMAVITNSNEIDRVGKVMKSIAASLSNVRDLYGELDASGLQDKLEAVSGMRITDSAQAAKASSMVNTLRGAADNLGMDQRAFLDMSANMQAQTRGRIAAAMGGDGRTSSRSAALTAQIHTKAAEEAAFMHAQGNAAVMEGRANGLNLANAADFGEIYEDQIQSAEQQTSRFSGLLALRGRIPLMSGEAQKRAQKILDASEEIKGTPEEQARRMDDLEQQSQGMIEQNTGSQFGRWIGTQAGQMSMSAGGVANGGKALQVWADNRAHGTLTKDISSVMSDDMGLNKESADKMATQTMRQLGLSGLQSLLSASKETMITDKDFYGKDVSRKMTGDERRSNLLDILNTSGIKGAEAEDFAYKLFDTTGNVQNMETFEKISNLTQQNQRDPSAYDKVQFSKNRLKNIGADSNRKVMNGEDGKLSLNSVITAISRGGLDTSKMDAEQLALSADMLGGVKVQNSKGDVVDLNSQMAKNMDFSQGLDLKELTRLNGGALDLHKKVINPATNKAYNSEEELIAATKGPGGEDALYAALNTLKTDKAYTDKFSLKGDPSSMTAITESAAKSLSDNPLIGKRLQKMGGAEQLARAMGLDEKYTNAMIKSAEKGGALDLSSINIGDWSDTERFKTEKQMVEGERAGEKTDLVLGASSNMHNVSKVIGSIATANSTQMKGYAAANEDGKLEAELTRAKEMLEFKSTKKGGGHTTASIDMGDGKGAQSKDINKAIQEYTEAITKLQNATLGEKGATVVSEMYVTHLNVKEHKPPNEA